MSGSEVVRCSAARRSGVRIPDRGRGARRPSAPHRWRSARAAALPCSASGPRRALSVPLRSAGAPGSRHGGLPAAPRAAEQQHVAFTKRLRSAALKASPLLRLSGYASNARSSGRSCVGSGGDNFVQELGGGALCGPTVIRHLEAPRVQQVRHRFRSVLAKASLGVGPKPALGGVLVRLLPAAYRRVSCSLPALSTYRVARRACRCGTGAFDF